MKRFFLFVLAMIAVVPALAQQPQKPAPKTVYIRAGRLFDGTGDKFRENVVIVVVGDRIQNVAACGRGHNPRGRNGAGPFQGHRAAGAD